MGLRRLFAIALVLAAVPAAAEPPRGSITIERIADIKYPTNPAWSSDGKRVAFLWDAAGKQDLFVVTPGSQPVALTDFPVDPDLLQSDLGAFAWISNDEILFGRSGQLWKVGATSGTPARMSGPLGDAGAFSLSPDRQTIAFIRRGNIWVGNVAAGTERQVTNLPEGLGAGVPVFSMDGRWLAFVANRGGLEPEDLPWNGPMVRSMENTTRERRLGVIAAQGGDVFWIPTVGAVSFPQFAADRSLVYYELSPDGKTKDIKLMKRDALPRVLWRDRDERWVSPTNRDVKLLVSPDGKQVAFVSDRSGWIHVYAMPLDATSESQAVQLTSGNFGTGLGSWSPDSKRIAYHHSASGNQMERFVDVVDVATKHSEAVVTTRGVNLDPLFSPDGQSIVVQRTDPQNSLDLYVSPVRAGAALTRLSDSMPTGLNRSEIVVPGPVSFPSRLDKAPVPGTLMVPRNVDKSRKHPAIVWIHGSGSDQNFLGWHPGSYRMYYSASIYLAQQGYVVITPDYRGSSGYSREWATGVHMGLGIKDAADVLASADYLKTLPFVDPDRIAVWGLSYGGYLTLQTMTQDPTLFRAGINVAGVVDWATYGAGYTTPRLGTPVENPGIYHESAPIYFMDKLARPLLVLHGTNDRNVQFRDSLRLWDVLLKLGKPFEMGVYPGEIHFFRRAHVLRDAWRRAEEFFDRYLKNGAAVTSSR
ncbi:MAG TPA: prolyl oligopeptidase family serine peptidase [Vicinamibacterales bacterium]|nr:prolyl oligopeptidase family serine peptidase [Vicinamibacterales bacterium]